MITGAVRRGPSASIISQLRVALVLIIFTCCLLSGSICGSDAERVISQEGEFAGSFIPRGHRINAKIVANEFERYFVTFRMWDRDLREIKHARALANRSID